MEVETLPTSFNTYQSIKFLLPRILFEFQSKSLCFCHYQQFLKEYDDKLIQKSVKIFKKELHVLKREQNFIIFSDDNSFNSLIFEINADVIFSVLSDDF